MITINFKSVKNTKDPVQELTMILDGEDTTRDELMRAFQQFLSGIGYVFPIEELGEYE
tara:strand:- start:95 stop:268 length:174 start_codon:yes stop_codon:yes gene_type:complete